MLRTRPWRIACPALLVLVTCAACDDDTDAVDAATTDATMADADAGPGDPSAVLDVNPTPVDFTSIGTLTAREAACAQDFANPAHIGSGAEPQNATNLWPSSPYLVLLPSSGTGYVTLSVDAPHFDWLIYLPAGVGIESSDGPPVEHNGPVAQCPEQALEEHGAHRDFVISWPLSLTGEPGTRVPFYAALAATDHTLPGDVDHLDHSAEPDDDAGTAAR